jgi:hypothetical protein
MAENIEDMKRRLAQLEYEIQKAEQAEVKFAQLADNKKLATAIHEKQCRWNHTDGCGWYYADSGKAEDWEEFGHAQYLEVADRILEEIDFQAAQKVISLL